MSVTLAIYNLEAKKVGEYSYQPFDEKLSEAVLAQVIRAYAANQHQGTRQAKTRAEVAHPDKKPWKQKGTGRARAGSRNSPIWVGGGVTFGPRAHTTRLAVSTTLKRKAMRFLLDSEVSQGTVVVFTDKNEASKTKAMADFLHKVNSFKLPVVAVVQTRDEGTAAMLRNIKNVKIRRASLLSPVDMNTKALFVFSEGALNALVDRVKKHDA